MRITREEIPKFVTQYDPNESKIAYFNYLAVQEVRIFCPFPDENVGKIAVVDMPGLGDTGIGDADRLVDALGQDIDFILFVRMPKHTGITGRMSMLNFTISQIALCRERR